MMQVHITSMLIATSLLFTAHVQPFGGENHELLQMLEMGSLMVTFLTLWCGGIFNSFPTTFKTNGNQNLTLRGKYFGYLADIKVEIGGKEATKVANSMGCVGVIDGMTQRDCDDLQKH